MDQSNEHKIRERAYALWQKEGSPPGRDLEFWERARLMVQAENSPPPASAGARSSVESAADQASVESFPASDPPAFTADIGAGKAPPAKRGGRSGR